MRAVAAIILPTLVAMHACTDIPGRAVRFEPTPQPVVQAMLELADVDPGDVIYDPGSGDGRMPITAARTFGARAVGIDKRCSSRGAHRSNSALEPARIPREGMDKGRYRRCRVRRS